MKHDTLDSLIQRVVTENERKLDLLADTRRMHVNVLPDQDEGNIVTLAVDDEAGLGVTPLLPSPHMLGQMATDLGIPKRYFDRMKDDAPNLFRRNVHHWLYEEPKVRMLRTYQPEAEGGAGTGRAWLSDRYRRLDNIEIALNLLPEFDRLDQEVKFHQASITDENFYLRAVFPRMEKEVKVGEAVQWGAQIRNSEVGAATFAIESYMLVLACTNGMVVHKTMNTRHVGKRLDDILSDEAIRADDVAFWLAARDTLRATLDEAAFDEAVETLRYTTESREMINPVAATKRLGKSYSLSDTEVETVLRNLTIGGDLTQYGALNAVTAAAKTVESFDRQVELETVGWNIADLSGNEWNKIAVAA